MWVNSLFKTSYWHDLRHGEHFVVQKQEAPTLGANTARELFWLVEWQKRCTPRWLHWKADTLHPAMSVAEVSVRYPFESMFCMCWTLGDWWTASAFTDSPPRKRRRHLLSTGNWCTTKFGLHPMHWGEMQVVGGSANVCNEKLVSTQLLMLALIHWSLTMENDSDKMSE